MTNNKRLCHKLCKSVYRYCHRRKEKIFCIKFRNEQRRAKEEYARKMEKIMMNQLSKNSIDSMIGEDAYDSIGNDISKSEFIENEIFFECIDE